MEKYTSKTKRNECKNEGCSNKRQDGSSRCLKCARKQEIIHDYMSALGKKGGNTTLERHGLDHYKERAKHMNEVIKQKKESLIN